MDLRGGLDPSPSHTEKETLPMSVLSRFVAFARVAWPPEPRFVHSRAVARGIIAIALAAAAASPAWAEVPQKPAHQDKKATAARDLNADGTVPNSIAKAGVETRVATVQYCDLPNQVPVFWARADHGTISIKRGTGPGCSLPSMNRSEIFYTSERGFKGTDNLHILGFTKDGEVNQTTTILVK
jgi:hypothetical protein